MLQGKTIEEGLYTHISFSDYGQAWAIDRSEDKVAFYLDQSSKKWTKKEIKGKKGRYIAALNNGDAWLVVEQKRTLYHYDSNSNAWQQVESQPGGSTKPQLLFLYPNVDVSRKSDYVTSALAGNVDPGGAGWQAKESIDNKEWKALPAGWVVDVAHDSETRDIWATNAYGDIWKFDRGEKKLYRMTLTGKNGSSATHAATVIGSQNSIFVLVQGRKSVWSKHDGEFKNVPSKGGEYPKTLARAPEGKGVICVYPNGQIHYLF